MYLFKPLNSLGGRITLNATLQSFISSQSRQYQMLQEIVEDKKRHRLELAEKMQRFCSGSATRE